MKTITTTTETAVQLKAYEQLIDGIYTALNHYSNVHRGSGHHSRVSTHLFEKAREIVLDYLGLKPGTYQVIFTNPTGLKELIEFMGDGHYVQLSSNETGLPLGVEALIVRKNALPKDPPPRTGGGNARLTASDWVIWARPPGRFEAGTPAIINIIAFAKALKLMQQYGDDVFKGIANSDIPAKPLPEGDDYSNLQGKALLNALRDTMPGRGVAVPTVYGEKPYVHFDHAASTLAFEPAWEAYRDALTLDEKARNKAVEDVREYCSKFLNAPLDVYKIGFTSGTTEAINLLARLIETKPFEEGDPVILSSVMEHSSNDLPWRNLNGHSLIRVSMDKEGFLDLKEIEGQLKEYNEDRAHGNKRISLVAVTAASNLLATYNDLKGLSEIVHRYNARLFLDAAQLVAHRPVDMKGMDIDFLAFSAHKVYAPFGTGVLLAKKDWINNDEPSVKAAFASGESNPAGILALGKALNLIERIGYEEIKAEEDTMTLELLKGLKSIPKMRLQGIQDEHSPNMSRKGGVFVFDINARLPGGIGKALAERQAIGVRYGCHCAHLLVKNMANIKGVGENLQGLMVRMFPRMNLPGLLRVSMGLGNTSKDIQTLIEVLKRIAAKEDEPGAIHSKQDVRKQIHAHVMELGHKVYG